MSNPAAAETSPGNKAENCETSRFKVFSASVVELQHVQGHAPQWLEVHRLCSQNVAEQRDAVS